MKQVLMTYGSHSRHLHPHGDHHHKGKREEASTALFMLFMLNARQGSYNFHMPLVQCRQGENIRSPALEAEHFTTYLLRWFAKIHNSQDDRYMFPVFACLQLDSIHD